MRSRIGQHVRNSLFLIAAAWPLLAQEPPLPRRHVEQRADVTIAAVLPQRTFVSAQRGSDGNVASNCSISNPCRSFGAALGVTALDGEIVALDTGGYGAVVIDKSVTLAGPLGVYVGITASSGNAIDIDAPAAVVVLRGLQVKGLGGVNGVHSTGVSLLVIEDSTFSSFSNAGVYVQGPGGFSVSRSSFISNPSTGLHAWSPGGIARGAVLQSRFDDSGFCLQASPGAQIVATDTAAVNSWAGFLAVDGGELTCTRCTAAHNNYGFASQGAGGLVRVNDSTVTSNTVGFGSFSGSVFQSMQNNLVEGNGTNATGPFTVITPR